MSDIIERAEAWRDHGLGSDPVPELVAALKAARAATEQLRGIAGDAASALQTAQRFDPRQNWAGLIADLERASK